MLSKWPLIRSEPRNNPTVLTGAAPLSVDYGAIRGTLGGGCSIGRLRFVAGKEFVVGTLSGGEGVTGA